MKISLLVMAAGIGSRYGGGIKQLAAVDQSGHIIMDYSVHDAIEAGFERIVFIIRRDIETDFRSAIGERIERVCARKGVEVCYAFQSLEDIPGRLPEGRSKPWGTGQAVLAAREFVDGPFAVINADDYYGKAAFYSICSWLKSGAAGQHSLCMAGFILKNTLSDNGGVTRGICQVDREGYLTGVTETRGIVKTPTGARAGETELDPEGYVSMNMWGLSPEFMELLEQGFRKFLEKDARRDPLGCEYLLPVIIGGLLQQGGTRVKVLQTSDSWFGVTYAEDRESVAESFKKLIEEGVYREDLFSDL